MPSRSTSLLLVLLVFPTSFPAAQTAASWGKLDLLRDSLALISDTSQVRTLLRQNQRDPVRAGLMALRLGELGGDLDFSEAVSRFNRASRQDPARAEAWFGLGQALEQHSQWEMRDHLQLGSRVGLGGLERAADDYRQALSVEAGYFPAAVALARLELSLLDTTRLRISTELVRRSMAAGTTHPSELLLSWGRLERATGNLEQAEKAFDSYLGSGGDRALGLLELARTRLARGDPAGDAPYYEGAALDVPEAVAQYRADLQFVAPDSILQQFDELRGQARAAFLHRFWTDRDHFELRPEGERLREHYRRLLFARTHFPLSISRRFYGPQDAYRSGNSELDDRGIIYIRQGEPAERLRPFIFGAMPNESWRYVRAEGDLLFHFSSGYDGHAGGDLYDYRLVESVLDLRGAEDAPRDQLILSRQSLSPIYSHMLNWGRYGSANEEAQERHIGATSIAVGTTTDSHELHFAHRLGVVADLIAVGQSPGGSLGHFVFGIAAAGASWRRTAEGVEYPVRVRLVALDRYNRSVASLDTSIAVRHQQPLSKKEFVVGRVVLPLPAGKWSYRAAVQQGDSSGVLLPQDTVEVPHDGRSALSLSDIAMGTPGRALPWVTETEDTVLLAPSGLFRERSDIAIYYEVRGTRIGNGYRHEIAVLPSSGKSAEGHPLVAVAFEELAAGPVIRSHRTVRLDRLKRGSYIVQVKVTGADGEQQVRRRLIHLIGSD